MYSRLAILKLATCLACIVHSSHAVLTATETAAQYVLANDRLYAAVNKTTGSVNTLTLDGQDLLGPSRYGGPYLDCYCITNSGSGAYTPGRIAPKYQLYKGIDASNVSYGGVSMSETYPPTGQVLEQYWFLRDGETGLHTFSRLAYHNATTPFLRNLQEFRTLFRPSTNLWTNLTTNAKTFAPLPDMNPASNASVTSHPTVQDATWYIADEPSDPYVTEFADYFTKYTFSDTWRDHDVHGMFSDGSTSKDGSTFGAWLVMNTRETYFGGPTHSDLMVDGIVYDYIVSNHHGAGTPNITDGFDRTFGPQYYHFNKGSPNATLHDLREEALQYYSPSWNAPFYDEIAKYVPNYIPSSGRTTFEAQVNLPKKAIRAIAVLAQNKADYQDNVQDTKAYQYWSDINSDGTVKIDRVIAGTYRLTIYAERVFGQYTQDDIIISLTNNTTINIDWSEETSGTEIFRVGTPDKSSGEYKNGYELDMTKPFQPEKHRIYWPAWDFPTDFPNGVYYTVGESEVGKDLNYVHWSVFGGYANSVRTVPYYDNVNNWTIAFNVSEHQIQNATTATFTVQLAGAKTAAGNTDVFNASEPHADLAYTVNVNGRDLDPWIIPYYHSSSCAVRSAVICYNIANQFVFNSSLLLEGKNEFVLSLPFNATDYESAVLPRSVYVQYDALRLEVK